MANKIRARAGSAQPRARRPRARGRRSQEESERTRTRILDRAERLFARRGYGGVSLRELSAACGVRPFTIQHHFGSKLQLYQSVLSRWDDEVRARVGAVLAERSDLATAVERVVDELFDFFWTRRSWVALSVRAALGDGHAQGVSLREQGWMQLIDASLREMAPGAPARDLGLLLISVEGLLHHHILSTAHYRRLYGADLGDPQLRERTKRHLKAAIVALVGGGAPARAAGGGAATG